MLYYKVKPDFDQKKRRDGSILVANELYTPREKERFNILDKAVYFFFGARFEGEKN